MTAMNSTPPFATQRVRVCRQLFTDEEYEEVCDLIRQQGATIVDESDYDVFHLVHYFTGVRKIL
jgi:DNA segregation ATPase FtsK/SpoIIIE-like protein